MTVGEKIEAALKPLRIPVKPWVLECAGKEYVKYNLADLRPDCEGDDWGLADRYFMQVHYFSPVTAASKVLRIRKLLQEANFEVSSVQEAYEDNPRLIHTTLEVEYLQTGVQP